MVVISKHYDRVIGIDLGNGLVKIKTLLKDGKVYKKTLPSVYGVLRSVGDSLDEREWDIDVFTIEGQNFVWGKDVIEVEEQVPSHGHAKRYTTTPYRNMVKIALAKVYNDIGIKSNESVLIVTGVPSDQTKKNDIKQELKNAFTNDNTVHDVKVNGEQVLFKIEEEDIIIMSQPVATVIGRYLDMDGNIQNKAYQTMKVAVVDVGGGTTDFDLIKGMRRLVEDCTSLNQGFRDVYDDIRAGIKGVYPDAEPTDFDLLKRIMSGLKNEVFTYQPNLRVEPYDFSEDLENSLKSLSAKIQGVISSIWKNQSDIDEILLVGGSASLFKNDIALVMDGLVVPDNNGDSNVDGYYKFGVCENNKVAESVF